MIDERRRFPRVAVVLPAVLNGPGAPEIGVLTRDLSRAGVNAACEPELAAALAAALERGEAGPYQVRIEIPLARGARTVSTSATLVHVSPPTGDPQAPPGAGLRIERFEGQGYDIVLRFLEENLEPATEG